MPEATPEALSQIEDCVDDDPFSLIEWRVNNNERLNMSNGKRLLQEYNRVERALRASRAEIESLQKLLSGYNEIRAIVARQNETKDE
jgi:hypothetical protein